MTLKKISPILVTLYLLAPLTGVSSFAQTASFPASTSGENANRVGDSQRPSTGNSASNADAASTQNTQGGTQFAQEQRTPEEHGMATIWWIVLTLIVASAIGYSFVGSRRNHRTF